MIIILIVFIIIYIYNNYYSKKEIKNYINHDNINDLQDFVQYIRGHKTKNALMVRNNKKWNEIDYETYVNLIESFSKSLSLLNINKECIAILGFNSPGWFISHLGIINSGNISVGIYPTSTTHGIVHILQESNAIALVVENTDQFEKISSLDNFNKLFPNLQYIISYGENLTEYELYDLNINYIPFNQFIKIGEQSDAEILKIDSPDYPATIIFTSGSTGKPKGVILTHKNIINNMKEIVNELIFLNESKNRIMSYLPLNHIASQITDIYMSGLMGFEVYFVDKDIFKTTMIDNLKSIRPTIFVGIPRVWEKIKEGIEQKTESSLISKYLLSYTPSIISNRILDEIGLDKCKYAITTSAPLNNDVRDFFYNISLNLYDIYGMSETSGPISISHPYNYKKGTVGKPLNNFKINIQDNKIFVGGNSVFLGYIGEPRNDFWFDTGDVGYIDNDGYLKITGREKDIIITSGGENITPTIIEDNIKSNINILKDVIVIGDGRKYLIALAVLYCDNYGKLTNKVIQKLKSLNINCNNLNEAYKNKQLHQYLNKQLETVNKNSLSQTQTIKKINLLPKPLSISNGELTPTMKIKRNVIINKYSNLINHIYNS